MTVAAPSSRAPIRICLFGSFRLFSHGDPVAVRAGGKAEQLLANLALNIRLGLPRDEILGLIWPESEISLASQSLNSLLYSLRKSLGPALASRTAIVDQAGRYRLNVDDGVGVDVVEFDAAVEDGDRSLREGDEDRATNRYRDALELYTGDLVVDSALQHLVERERLRARFLAARAHVADHDFALGDYDAALGNALQILAHDPCREDAHRMAMRCYVRLGARAQAVRQYRICRRILADEFEAEPETSTEALFALVRLDPARV